MTKFKNESQPAARPDHEKRPGSYGYDAPSDYLLAWTSLFQSTISQAGTYLLTKKFHDHQTGIYKAEGGCNIVGIGDLVLGPQSCRFDHDDKTTVKHGAKLAKLITDVVLAWDPMDPVNTMINSAAQSAGCSADELKKALEKHRGGPFNGNAISYFFDWNRRPELNRKYLRWCLINISKQPANEVDQQFEDEDMAKALLEKLQTAHTERNDRYGKYRPSSCKAERKNGELKFLVGCGGPCNIDGWRTKEAIEAFLKSDEKFHE